MKVLTLNFLTCAVKACKSAPASHPLHPKDAELVQDELELNSDMIVNVLPRLDWTALRTTSSELGFPHCQTSHQPPRSLRRMTRSSRICTIFFLRLRFPRASCHLV
ncbi:hypothetical protein V2G26_008174 [Clonostachys chloroleuca]